MDMSRVVGAITEIFSWIGFGGAIVFGLAAVVARLADGTWVAVHGFLLEDADPPVVRWFGAGHAVGEAPLTAEIRRAADDADELDLFTRPGRPGSARLHERSPLPRLLGWSAVAFGSLGVVSTIVQLVLAALR
ncbi:hypothetical protein N8K70_05300 [Microbacterium betulae]|uniref:DUF3592 domain-containing protein n=1 Tax=Microbacterium betulae TaxID=2981139 RepID=A0AA97I829_9MICO|nr:hypothetical protein [Microbacterium sp. AB]WOF24090.1 hypothetical protein N8K70_05300 [Microbacterium sp. AB]